MPWPPRPECHAPGFTPSRTCEPRSSGSGQPPSGYRADPCRSGSEPPMRLCCGASKQPTRAAGSSPRRTAGCVTSSPGPLASNAQPDPSNPANPPAVVSARQRSARAEQPQNTGRSHVENTVRIADAQVREREVDQAKDNPAAGRSFVGVHDRDIHHGGCRCPQQDAALGAGAGLRGGTRSAMIRKVSYEWHLRHLMADRGLFATTELRPLLAERGVVLSREQVYRLVARTPARLSLATLAALCDILGCGPGDLVEPVPGA